MKYGKKSNNENSPKSTSECLKSIHFQIEFCDGDVNHRQRSTNRIGASDCC